MVTPAISPFDDVRDTRPRALFFAHDSLGLGHIRRVLALAGELARRRPDIAMLVITSSFFGGAWEAPANLDLIKLPSLSRRTVYEDNRHLRQAAASPAPGRRADRSTPFLDLRSLLIQQVAATFDPWLFVADNEPVGLISNRELLPTLEAMRSGSARTRLVLGLRDIYDSPEWVRYSWPRRGITKVLEEAYDQILIYGDQSLFDSAREFRLPASIAEKLVYTGYIRKQEQLTPAVELREDLGAGEGPLVVVTTGGGWDGSALVRAYVQALHAGLLPGIASFVVAGPLMTRNERASIHVPAHVPATRVGQYEDELTSWINAADLVVSMAGYNTVTEALGFGKRMLVVPRMDPGEQHVRATRMSARGLLRMLLPDDLSPERLAREVLESLAAPPPVVDLDFGGLERAGALLSAALR